MVYCQWYHDYVRWTHIVPHDRLSFGFDSQTANTVKQAVIQRRNDESANSTSWPCTRFSNARLQSTSQHSRHGDSNTGSTSLSNRDPANSHRHPYANTVTNEHAS